MVNLFGLGYECYKHQYKRIIFFQRIHAVGVLKTQLTIITIKLKKNIQKNVNTKDFI